MFNLQQGFAHLSELMSFLDLASQCQLSTKSDMGAVAKHMLQQSRLLEVLLHIPVQVKIGRSVAVKGAGPRLLALTASEKWQTMGTQRCSRRDHWCRYKDTLAA